MARYAKLKGPKSSLFNLSHEKKLTCDFGDLVPVQLQEVIPGDRFSVNTELIARFQPMVAPIMQRVEAYVHHFFVPYRLVWVDFESFITGGTTGLEAPNFPKIRLNIGQLIDNEDNINLPNVEIGSLMDYFGVSITENIEHNDLTGTVEFSQLPFRAYQKIYNDYYRGQDFIDEVDIDTGSDDIVYVYSNEDDHQHPKSVQKGLNDLLTLRKRAWGHDYFTEALPFTQRGPQVSLPLVGDGIVKGKMYVHSPAYDDGSLDGEQIEFRAISPMSGELIAEESDIQLYAGLSPDEAHGNYPEDGMRVDFTSPAIEELEEAFALQRFFRRMMLGGARYIEQIKTIFGVKSSDARLQRPQFLGGQKIPIKISEVVQTSESGENSPQGNMSGLAFGSGSGFGFRDKFFEEHGFIISILSVRPKTSYQFGIPKIFNKFDRFDYFFPDFAHLGEQPIFKREIFSSPWQGSDEEFGYQPRYEEYRQAYDTVHGLLKTDLKHWTWTRLFEYRPALNSSFINCEPTDQIWPVQDDTYHKVIIQMYNDVKAVRPIPKFPINF